MSLSERATVFVEVRAGLWVNTDDVTWVEGRYTVEATPRPAVEITAAGDVRQILLSYGEDPIAMAEQIMRRMEGAFVFVSSLADGVVATRKAIGPTS